MLEMRTRGRLLSCRSCRRLRSFDLASDCSKVKIKDRSLRQLLQVPGFFRDIEVAGLTLSRAGSLPQVLKVFTHFVIDLVTVGASLLAKFFHSLQGEDQTRKWLTICCNCPPNRASSTLDAAVSSLAAAVCSETSRTLMMLRLISSATALCCSAAAAICWFID